MLSINNGDNDWTHYVSHSIVEEMRDWYELGIDEREAKKLIVISVQL